MSDPPAPLSSRYASLRAQFNEALAALYERTALPVRDIAAAAGVTDREIYAMVRRLGLMPRRSNVRYRGRTLGVRRAGPAPKPLDAEAAARTLAAFGEAVAALADERQARLTAMVLRGQDMFARRERQAAARQSSAALYELRLCAAALRQAFRRAPPPNKPAAERMGIRPHGRGYQWRPGLVTPLTPSEPAVEPPRPALPEPPQPEPEFRLDPKVGREIDEIAERYYAREREGGPRIRKWW